MRATKFILSLLAFVAASTFLGLGWIGEDVWFQTTATILAAYVTGNVASTFAHKWTSKS